MKIKELPTSERPRERLVRFGVKALSDSELLAIILRTGSKQENVLDLSQKLLQKYNLRALSQTNISELRRVFGVGQAKACQILACFELARRLGAYTEEERPVIKTPHDVARLITPELRDLKQEHFILLCLDARKRLIKKETVFIGSLDASTIHPREIFKTAAVESAAAIIFVHNHPSGDPAASEDDVLITKELAAAGKLLGIEVVDHIIIGSNEFMSFREAGLLS